MHSQWTSAQPHSRLPQSRAAGFGVGRRLDRRSKGVGAAKRAWVFSRGQHRIASWSRRPAATRSPLSGRTRRQRKQTRESQPRGQVLCEASCWWPRRRSRRRVAAGTSVQWGSGVSSGCRLREETRRVSVRPMSESCCSGGGTMRLAVACLRETISGEKWTGLVLGEHAVRGHALCNQNRSRGMGEERGRAACAATGSHEPGREGPMGRSTRDRSPRCASLAAQSPKGDNRYRRHRRTHLHGAPGAPVSPAESAPRALATAPHPLRGGDP